MWTWRNHQLNLWQNLANPNQKIHVRKQSWIWTQSNRSSRYITWFNTSNLIQQRYLRRMHKRTSDSKTSIIILIKWPSIASIHIKSASNRLYPKDGPDNLVNILRVSFRIFSSKEHHSNSTIFNKNSIKFDRYQLYTITLENNIIQY